MKRNIPRTAIVGLGSILMLTFAAIPSLASDANPPDVEIEDRVTWFPNAHHLGFQAHAEACDERSTVRLSLTIKEVGSASETGNSPCLEVSETFTLPSPGDHKAKAEAQDDHGNEARNEGKVTSRIVPFDTGSVPGYPPLEEIRETELGPRVTIETLNDAGGTVKRYEVSSQGAVLMSTMADAVPEDGDFTTRAVLDRPVGWADVHVDGDVTWSGLIYQSSEEWWHFRALK
ncbi:hypothetical protein BRD56_00570 [Thermoplasmatales archaeon SW_10_69_26]|nr:MAG: hypothetical protein BRD56_00570 [Thermoplasmatales archaeon SW_10_69_26]